MVGGPSPGFIRNPEPTVARIGPATIIIRPPSIFYVGYPDISVRTGIPPISVPAEVIGIVINILVDVIVVRATTEIALGVIVHLRVVPFIEIIGTTGKAFRLLGAATGIDIRAFTSIDQHAPAVGMHFCLPFDGRYAHGTFGSNIHPDVTFIDQDYFGITGTER